METVLIKPCPRNMIEFQLQPNYAWRFESIVTLSDNSVPIEVEEDQKTFRTTFHNVRLITRILTVLGFKVDYSLLNQHYSTPLWDKSLGQQYLRDEQWEFVQKIEKYFSGLITLPTGFGKGTMIVYLIQASMIRDGNILLLAPMYSIVEELKMRAERYNVSISLDYDTSSRIWAINPVGLVNSKRLEDPAIVEWLSNTTTLIMDECQEINNSQEELIDEYLYNCVYRYGLSATSDKFHGLDLTSLTNLWKINPETYRILERFGPAIVYKAPQKRIRVVETPVYCGNYRNYYSYDKCVNQVCHCTAFPRYIERCIKDNNKYQRSTILFPFTNSNHIKYLMEEELLKKYHLVLWTAKGIEHNNGEPYEKGAGLPRMKELINNHEVDLVFASSVSYKGVDFNQLKSVMFVTSSSYGMVTQILGRIFRYEGEEYPTVYLLNNKSDNPLFNASYRKRKEVILRNDHISETLSLF